MAAVSLNKKQNILIIGGSRFVGPYLARILLNRGHNLTIFNRGLSQSKYPANVRFVRGDRNKGFILKECFDSVVDMCAYSGAQTEVALKQLRFNFFLHFSTVAVYKKTKKFPLTENSPLGDWPAWEDYNKGKVECEKVLQRSGIKYASIRPVYILGPKNYCDRERFIYSRIKNHIPLIIPGDGRAKIQFVFAAEVAEAMAAIAEKQIAGNFNCAGDEIIFLADLTKMMGKIVGRQPILKFNRAADGENFNESEFPFANENMICDNGKIKALGLKFRPLAVGLKEEYEKYYRDII